MSLLIIGPTPPPIGGVTIHVKRLLESLESKNSIEFQYFNLIRDSKRKLFRSIHQSEIIHLHTSNSYFRFFVVAYCRLFLKKVIFTFHGDVGRYNRARNLFDKMSIILAQKPIMINQSSFKSSLKFNKNTVFIPAFIPPKEILSLDINLDLKINNLIKKHEFTFCTNAYDVSYDKNGEEIYKIFELIEIFSRKKLENKLLIISDPSGNYKKSIAIKGIALPKNILIISYPHDFNAVLQKSNCFIRYTTTDGDSLSVKEALLMDKNVIASDVVTRPSGVQLTKLSPAGLESLIINYCPSTPKTYVVNGFIEIFELYKEMNL